MRPKLHSSSRPFKDFIDRFSNSRAFRPKRKRSSNSVAYETLEPKQLLATLVASYSADFPSPGGSAESGWQYQWNAPVNGNNGSGAIDNPQTQFAQMQDTGIATSWTPDGDLIATTNPSAAYVRLTSAGGHPGLGEFSGRAGRYAIASYTVSDSGFYSIDNSYVGLSPLNTSRTNDGVEFRVFVNRDAPVEQGAVDPFTKSYFDTELGFLAAGDTVHVAFGSNGTAFADFFTMDYDIVRAVELEDNVGNFRSDFLTQPASDTDGYGWNYYWNAPDGWIGDGQTGNQRSGAIGDASSYEQLRLVDSIWTADGDLNGLNSRPDYFLKVDPTGGQAGNGFASAVLQDRFAISGYTIEHSGLYAISDSFLSVAENSDDGVEVYIHVGTGDQLNERTIVAGGDSSSFDTELGYLKKGDTIYVGFGANGNHLFDRYETDFSVVRHLPRAAPDLSVLEQTGEVVHVGASHFGQPGAVINDNRNDWQAIKNAFQHALDIEAHEVRFEPGIYNLTSTGLSDTDPFFELERFSNLVINGNGATFISGDFGRSIINVHFASNVVIQDLTIDYAERVPATNGQTNDLYKPLTFTQGRITEVDHEANTFTVSVNTDAFVRPDSSFSTNGENGWGYAIDPFVDGRLKPNTDWHYPTLGVENGAKTDHFVVSTIDTEGLESGDRYVLIRRRNNSAIGFYNGSSNVSVIGVTAYSSPSVFVASIGSDSVNVIDSSVEIRPDDWPGVAETGRWKSINGDGVHIQSSRNGAWVENSSFDGLGDDVMNFYSLPMTVLEKVSTNSFTVAMLVRDRLASISNAFIQPGDTLSFFDPVVGKLIREARVVSSESSMIPSPMNSSQSIRVQTFTIDQAISEVTESDVNVQYGVNRSTMIFNESLSRNALVQDSYLGNSRRYGNYLLADNVHLVDNVYEGLSDEAVTGHNEPGWPLGLYANDILVQGNTFVNNGMSARYLGEEIHTGVVSFKAARFEEPNLLGEKDLLVNSNQYAFSDLEIRDNLFYQWSKSAISVRNARDVSIVGNVVVTESSRPGIDLPFDVHYSDSITLDSNSYVGGTETLTTTNATNLSVEGTRTVANNDLHGWFTFDRGEVFKDSSGSGLTAEFVGAATTSARFDNGAIFNRTNHVAVQDDVKDIEARAISLWFDAKDVSSNLPQVIYDEGGPARGMNIYVANGKVYVGAWSQGVFATFLSTDVESDQWNHVSLVMDGNFGKLRGYLNGSKFAAGDAAVIRSHNGNVTFGADRQGTRFHGTVPASSGDQYGFVGKIDDVRIYDRVVGDGEIEGLAEAWGR